MDCTTSSCRTEPQAKLVRASQGVIFGVAVNVRQHSSTFGLWVEAELSQANAHQLWIPEGFAHGFLTLSPVAEVQYKARGFWNRDCERAIRWDDPTLAISWPLERLQGAEVNLSARTLKQPASRADRFWRHVPIKCC